MQKNVEIFMVGATIEMFDCGEPDCWSRLAFDHFHRDLLRQQSGFVKLALNIDGGEPCVAAEPPAHAPAITDEQHRHSIGADAMTDGKNSMTCPLGVRILVRNAAGRVGTIEGVGDDKA